MAAITQKKMINAMEAVPTIKIDEDLKPAVARGEGKNTAITVEILQNGSFRVEGGVVNRDELSRLLKVAVEKKPGGVLRIRAEEETEFKYVQRVIKSAAAAGIKKVAYASFNREATGEE